MKWTETLPTIIAVCGMSATYATLRPQASSERVESLVVGTSEGARVEITCKDGLPRIAMFDNESTTCRLELALSGSGRKRDPEVRMYDEHGAALGTLEMYRSPPGTFVSLFLGEKGSPWAILDGSPGLGGRLSLYEAREPIYWAKDSEKPLGAGSYDHAGYKPGYELKQK